jgi:hypothetical protein
MWAYMRWKSSGAGLSELYTLLRLIIIFDHGIGRSSGVGLGTPHVAMRPIINI